eukprot:g3207.t1
MFGKMPKSPPRKKQRRQSEGDLLALSVTAALRSLLSQLQLQGDPVVDVPKGCSIGDALTAIQVCLSATGQAAMPFSPKPQLAELSASLLNDQSKQPNRPNSLVRPTSTVRSTLSRRANHVARRGSLAKGRDRLRTLPGVLTAKILSYLTVHDHFACISRLSWVYRRFLLRRSAWPRELTVSEDETQVFLVNSWDTPALTVPEHALATLGRLGFSTIHGCGKISLPLLANPRTRRLNCRSLELKAPALAPLASMDQLEDMNLVLTDVSDEDLPALTTNRLLPLKRLQLHSCNKITHAGLSALSGLPIEELKIGFASNLTDDCLYALSDLPLKKLTLYSCKKITGTGLAALAGLPLLELNLDGTDITNESLGHLAGLPLKKLGLFSCKKITGEGLAHLQGLPLEDLNVDCTNVTDDCLKSLVGLPLKKLGLYSCKNITGQGLTSLRDLPLEELNLGYIDISDSSLLALKNLQKLKTLQLSGCKNITGKGLAALAGLPLVQLNLDGTNVTDACLGALAGLSLKTLGLSGCSKISGKGLAALAGLPLEDLDLNSTELSNDCLRSLVGLPLKKLQLFRCKKIGRKGLAAISALPLEELHLSHSEIEDSEISALVGLVHKKIRFHGARVEKRRMACFCTIQTIGFQEVPGFLFGLIRIVCLNLEGKVMARGSAACPVMLSDNLADCSNRWPHGYLVLLREAALRTSESVLSLFLCLWFNDSLWSQLFLSGYVLTD